RKTGPRPTLFVPRAAASVTGGIQPGVLARHWPQKGLRQDAFLALAGGLLRAGCPEEKVGRLVGALAEATGDEEARKRVAAVAQTARKLQQEQRATGWPKLAELLGAQGGEVVRRARQWLSLAAPDPPGSAGGGAVPAARPRVLEPYEPFPVGALPAPIDAFARQGALALGCDPAYLALPALAAAAAAVGNSRALRLKRGWEEPCVLWSVIVGDSGTLKSPAYLKAVAHLFRLQHLLLREHREALARYQRDKEEYELARREARKEGGHSGPPPEKPVLPRVVCSDTTIEKLAEILEDTPRGTLVARDELAAWLGSFTRYKGKQGGSDLPNWLEMFRAGTVVVDRKTGPRPTLFVPRAAASVTGGIQPGVLARALTEEFLEAGLAARLLMAMPPKRPKKWTEAEVEPDVERAYREALDRLLALESDECDGEPAPYVLGLSADAKACWVRFYDEWGREQAGAEGELAAALSKLEAYAARLALVHHVVTCAGLEVDDRREVGVRSVEAGVALCRWFAREARRVYATLSETAEERDERRLVEFVRARGGRVRVKELQRSNQRKYPTAGAAEAALEALVRKGLGRWEECPPSPRGGRPTRDFVLCVTYDETDETPGGEWDRDGDETSDDSPGAPDDTPWATGTVDEDDRPGDSTQVHAERPFLNQEPAGPAQDPAG
ncbi:MAG TPA: DUF3987 domain-containing protein, partial [Gemmataceae bacterium]